MVNKEEKRRRNMQYIALFFGSILFGVIVIVVILAVSFFMGQRKFLETKKEAKLFIDQFISSVHSDTDFYKTKTKSDTIAKVKASRELISDQYTISTIDYSWGVYEGKILFDNGLIIKVDISFRESENKPYRLIHWHKIE